MTATDSLQGFRLSPRQARLFRRGEEGRQGWSASVRLAGRADPARLEDALSRLVDGHEILRTDFPLPPGLKVPLQSVREGGFPPPFTVVDAHADAVLAGAALRDALEARFAPLEGRGWRAVLVRGPDADRLAVALSGALADGTTPVLVLSQWLALAADRAAAPAEGVAQFADIAEWLCQQLEDEHAASAAAFWQGVAAKAVAGPVPEVIGGKQAGSTAGTGTRRAVPVVLAPAAAATLERWRALGTAALRARLLAAWAALLARAGGRESFGIAVTLPGRDLPELAVALGPIDTVVPVAVAVDAERPLGDLAATLDAALASTAHHKLALPDAVAGGPAGMLPVGFELTEWPDLAPWGVLETVQGSDGDAALVLRAGLAGGRLSLDLLTDPACLSAEAASRMGRMLATLLGAADGTEAVAALPLADAEALAEVLAFGSGAELPAGPETSVLTLIAGIAGRHAGHPAVAGAGRDLTYGTLWRMAGGIAAALAAHGAPDGAGPAAKWTVGVAMPRTPLAIAAILGVLRAGAAYVPVDPSWPDGRILAVLTDAGVTAVLAEPAQAESLAAAGLRVINPETAAAGPDEPPAAVPAAQDPAYVIYTSGSTGRPKGVPISHGNLLASTRARMAAYDRPVGRYLLLSPLFFDSSVAGLFWTLAQGGTLVLPAPGEERDAAALRDIVAGRQVTHLLCLPGLWAAILDDAWPEDLASLEAVIVAGERCTADLVERHAERLPAVPLHNEYGPTEATVWSTVWRWAGGPVPRTIPIGRPIPGTLIRVLDRAGRPVPLGVAGEIRIGGPGVAAGYLNQPELTAERFRPDPADGGTLYATGDLGSWQEDGSLLFHGRADEQIKLRGYRIEPGEVEAALASHPAVGRAAVLLREDRPGERRLVAYAAVPGGTADAEALRDHAARRLPDWMVPAAVVVLPSLPLLPNGKIDRRALPAPETAGSAGRPRQAPRTAMEQRLSELWGAVLNIDPPGVDEDFFRLGGDSLLGLQMVARARQAGVKLTSAQLFEHPTIARLAEVAEVIGAGPAAAPSVPGREVPLTPIQRWLLSRNSPEPHQYNQAIALDLRRPLVRATLEAAAARLPALHDALTLAFQPLPGGGWRQSVGATPAALPVTWLEVGGLPAPARTALAADALAKAQSGFRLGQPPLLRFVYVAAGGDGPDRLHAIAHHLVVDALSWSVLMEDLEAGYLALEAGGSPAEPHRSASFADHADALAAAAVALCDPAAALRRAWAAYLARPVRPLPLDHAAAGNDEAHAGIVTARLDPAATAAFLTGAGPGPHRLLLASVGAVLARYAGGGVLRLDCERHGRHGGPADLDRSRSVGWFTEIHPVLLDLPAGGGTAAMDAALAQLDGVPGSGDGYGLLVRPPAGVEPLDGGTGEVLVNYLGQVDASLTGSALFAYSTASSGQTRSGVTPRSHLLEIDAEVSGDELRIDWTFSTQCHARATIAALAEEHAALLARCGRF